MPEAKQLKYINSLNPNKSSRFVMDVAPIIVGPLRHILNLSLIQGKVPDELKNARVVPVFKKSDRLSVGNYLPVSM